MSNIRVLNLISFGLLLLAFVIAAGKSDEQSSSERVMIERMKAAAEIVQSTKEKNYGVFTIGDPTESADDAIGRATGFRNSGSGSEVGP